LETISMRVFVTGASGWVGSAVVKELLANGHSVLGMARSDEGAAKVAAAGADVHRGTLEDLDSIAAGTVGADGVVHAAFSHDFSKFEANGLAEKAAIGTLVAALAGSDRPLIITSGTAMLGAGQLVTEDTKAPDSSFVPRAPEQSGFAGVDKGVRVSAIRLPPSVHGDGDHGFVAMLTSIAREKGEAAYVSEGANRWPSVHRFDAARLYRLALEKGRAGVVYQAVAEEGIPFRDIATAIGNGLNLPVVSKTPDDAATYFGWFARFGAIDNHASSAKTRAELGWAPREQGLLADLAAGYYFK
jgi:nucleoside-diphosphate-sugar epimerase